MKREVKTPSPQGANIFLASRGAPLVLGQTSGSREAVQRFAFWGCLCRAAFRSGEGHRVSSSMGYPANMVAQAPIGNSPVGRFKKIFERSKERRVHSGGGTLPRGGGPMPYRELRRPRMIQRSLPDSP